MKKFRIGISPSRYVSKVVVYLRLAACSLPYCSTPSTSCPMSKSIV